VSGPLDCNAPKYEDPTKEEEDKQNLANVPMQELEVCSKSPQVKSVDELQEEHVDWMQNCYTNASKAVATNFNPFYQRFAKMVDRLAWKAGCGPHPDLVDTEDYTAISDQFNFKSFSECDWSQSEAPENDEWMPDRERARGWTGTSKVILGEQQNLKMQYPLPLWLERRQKMLSCLTQVSGNGQQKAGGNFDTVHPELEGASAGVLNAISAEKRNAAMALDDSLQGKETEEDPQKNTGSTEDTDKDLNRMSGDSNGSEDEFEGSTLD
jgi:hypothetical protein